MDDMNNWGYCELKLQDVMKNSWLRIILMILGREIKALIIINRSELWMTRTTPGHELKTQDTMNNSGLCMK